LGGLIEGHVADGHAWGLQVTYSREGERLRGTGGALRLAFEAELLDESFFVLYGDSYLSVNLADVERAFRGSTLPSLMTVYRNEGRWGPSNVVFRDGKVVTYGKNLARSPREVQWIDYGICIITRDLVRDSIPRDQIVDLAQLFTEQAALGRVGGYEVDERFYEIGSPTGLADLERRLLGSSGRW
jgi:NDP-sugar pyrophosphorylase family protein